MKTSILTFVIIILLIFLNSCSKDDFSNNQLIMITADGEKFEADYSTNSRPDNGEFVFHWINDSIKYSGENYYRYTGSLHIEADFGSYAYFSCVGVVHRKIKPGVFVMDGDWSTNAEVDNKELVDPYSNYGREELSIEELNYNGKVKGHFECYDKSNKLVYTVEFNFIAHD